MRNLLPLFLISCFAVSLTSANFFMRMPPSQIADSVNPINPNFDYPEKTEVNPSDASIPYAAKFNTGYITVHDQTKSKIFYVVYPAGGETKASADFDNKAPLILWLNGGPGCSDATGNYEEIGPYRINKINGKAVPVAQAFNWNDKYNLLFVDSPAGVGYSVNGGEKLTNSVELVVYLQTFLIRFFQIYPSLSTNDFYIFGESYAGHYIPALASLIVQNNTQNKIHLKGIGIGDGWTDASLQIGSFSSFSYSTSHLDDKGRNHIFTLQRKVKDQIKAGEHAKATETFGQITSYIGSINSNIDIYNFENYGGAGTNYTEWLNSDSVKKAYGVDLKVTFKGCVGQVYSDFYADIATSYLRNYTYLLTQKVIPDLRVLIYTGQNDIIVNTVGSWNFAKEIEWPESKNFYNAKKKPLKGFSGEVVGNYKTHKGLTFATIYNAGHMIPTDQPSAAKQMLELFIQNKYTDTEVIEI